MTWIVYLTRKAYKQLVKLPYSVQDLADQAVTDLEEQGVHPKGWDILKTGEGEFRLPLSVWLCHGGEWCRGDKRL